MAQADGTIIIDTHIETGKVQAGTKQIEASAKRMANKVNELGDSAKASVEKTVAAITKQNVAFAQQERKVENLKKKVEEYSKQKIPTEEYKEIANQISEDEKRLNKLIAAQEKYLSLGGKEGDKTYKSRQYDIDQLTNSIRNAKAELQGLEDSGKAFLPGSETEQAKRAIESLRVEMAKLDSTGATLQSLFNNLYATLGKYDSELVNSAKYTGLFQSTLNGLKSALHAPISVAKLLVSSLKKLPSTIARIGLNGAISAFRKFYDVVKKATVALSDFVKAKITSGFKKISSGILGINKSANKTTFSLGKMLATSILFSAVFRAISAATNAIKSGITNLAQYSDETNGSISMLWGSLETLKNSLATAFSPILNVIAPILSRFIDMLSTAASYVSMFFSALTGKSTYTKAIAVQKDYAGSLEDTATGAKDAADATNEAAEAAEDYLSPLDDINRYTSTSSSSSGGSGGTGGGGGVGSSSGPLFEEVEIEPISFDSWGEAFNAFLDFLLQEGIPALRSALEKAASVINTFSSNLYQMFTFPGVLEKVQLLGKEIAMAFNDFVNLVDWNMLGSALGSGLNLALQFLVNLIYTFDWMNLGASLANMINSAIVQIDWYAFGQLLWAKFKIAIETLVGFLLNLDMAELAQAASRIVIGFFESMTETIQNIDWQQLGNQIKDFLVNLDWKGIATAVFTAIGAAFGALVAFLWGLIKDAWSQVVAWWYDNAYEDGKFTLQGLLLGILDVIKSIGKWIKENIFDPFIDGFKSVFGIHSPSTVMAEMGRYIMQGLLNGISELISMLKSKFVEIKDIIVEKITNAKDGAIQKLQDLKTGFFNVVSKIKQKFQTVFDSFVGIVKSPINGIISMINSLLNKVETAQNWIAQALSFSIDLPGWAEKLTGYSSFGISVPSWNIPNIPYLASGAVIPPNKEFMAVLGDQTSGNNIEAPESLIRKIVREESGGGGNKYDVNVKVGRRELLKIVIDEAKIMRDQNGKNVFELG